MVKLEVKIKGEKPLYFYTMADCNEYLYVFKNYWHNVPFGKPKEIPDDLNIIRKHKSQMDKDPKQRAKTFIEYCIVDC